MDCKGKMHNKTVIITGGGKGIGFGVATAFAKEGANLVLTGRTPSTLEKAKDSLEKDYGIKVLTVVADGGDEASAQLVAEKAMEAFGRIDTLVNNAQNSKSGVLLVDHTKEEFDQAIYSGLYGLSRVAAAEWGPDGVRVNIVAPLAMTKSLEQWREAYPALYEKTISDIPLGRFGDPETDIGRVCVFLASEDAAYITGETISLQGGSGRRP